MAEKELPREGDTIDQSGLFGVGDNKGKIDTQNLAGTVNEKIGKNNIQAKEVNIHEHHHYYSSPEICSEPDTPQTPVNPEQKTDPVKAMVVLSAKLTADNRAQYEDKKFELEAIVEHLRQITGDNSIKLTLREKGSIKLFLEGSPEGLKKLKELFESGELTEVLRIPVEEVQLLLEERRKVEVEAEEETIARLVEEIRTQGAKNRDLRGVNLNYANLHAANLTDANLSGANLTNANLSDANLSDVNLSSANLYAAHLIYVNLSGANLSRANLSRANLYGANLNSANVEKARFGYKPGISESMKQDLISRGAIFEDSPEDSLVIAL